ncbi:MAG: CcmD family protein [Desulfovibrio sp.]|nr:CcmD family protein [Desulfovibrio sp.]
MEATTYILIANIAVWSGIGLYTIYISKKISSIEKKVKLLEYRKKTTSSKELSDISNNGI